MKEQMPIREKEKQLEFSLEQPAWYMRVPTCNDAQAAETVSRWTQEAKTMLPKTTEEILGLFAQQNSVLVVNGQGELMCHAAATFTYGDGSIEIGGIYTAPQHRNKGLAIHAVGAVIAMMRERNPESNLFALANIMSKPMFLKMGGREMNSSELGAEVWEPCGTCPKNLASNGENVIFQCCDTPVDLTNVKTDGEWQYAML